MTDFGSVPVPVIPTRPAIYPSPVSYDGSYGTPPMSFCKHNENDFNDNLVASMHHSKKKSSQRKPMREKGWEVDHIKNECKDISKSVLGKESPFQPLCNQQGQFLVAPVNLLKSKANAVDECLLKKPEPMATEDGRRSDVALQGRVDYKGRGNFSSQENEEGKRKPAGTPTSVMSSRSNVDAQLGVYTQDHCKFKEVSKEEESNP